MTNEQEEFFNNQIAEFVFDQVFEIIVECILLYVLNAIFGQIYYNLIDNMQLLLFLA